MAGSCRKTECPATGLKRKRFRSITYVITQNLHKCSVINPETIIGPKRKFQLYFFTGQILASEMAGTAKFGRRDSLVKQASLDRIQLEGIKRRNTVRHRKQLEKSILCKQVNDFQINTHI